MNIQISYRGTTINKIHYDDAIDAIERKGLNADVLFNENDFMYVSDGFMRGLAAKENGEKEWHH